MRKYLFLFLLFIFQITGAQESNDCTQTLLGSVVDSETLRPVPNARAIIFKDNRYLTSVKSNGSGIFEESLQCNSNYRIVISSKSHNKKIINLITENGNNQIIQKNLAVSSKGLVQKKNKVKEKIRVNPIHFEINETKIAGRENLNEIDKVVELLFKESDIAVEVRVYTDSRTPDHISLDLTNKRANSIVDHMISKGIDPERLIAKGFGESKLLNVCSNGIKCSEMEHEINRRVEFIKTPLLNKDNEAFIAEVVNK